MKMKRLLRIASVVSMLLLIGSMTCFSASVPEPAYPKVAGNVTLTWWSWTSNAEKIAAEFTKVYPNIKIVHPLIGSGMNEYTKLQTVLQAGSGAPDVVQIEFQYLPQFIDTGGLLDISKYAKRYKPYFLDWTWAQCSRGSKLYAIPEDIGPLGFLYRPDVFRQAGLTVPKTYQDLAADAAKFHQANPQKYYTFFPLNDPGYTTGLFWQAGARPFQYVSGGWKVNINDAAAKKVLNFWGDLVKKGYVKATNDWTPQWQSEIGSGLYGCMIGAAWSPSYELQPYVRPETANWNAADIPQWTAGAFKNGNWGGSTNAVTTQCKNSAAAVLFAAWLNTSRTGIDKALQMESQGGRGLFSANKYAPENPLFSAPSPALANQVASAVWTKAANAVNVSFQWSPWTDYVYKQLNTELTKASQNEQTWAQALDRVQANTVGFAKSMGYKIVSNPGESGVIIASR